MEKKISELFWINASKVDKRVVSGRELYSFLNVKTRYNDWIRRMIAYGFKQGKDYQILLLKNEKQYGWGGSNKIDHIITQDMAKKISMVQHNEKGAEVRQYFIACEEALEKIRDNIVPQTRIEALRAAADALEREEQDRNEMDESHDYPLF